MSRRADVAHGTDANPRPAVPAVPGSGVGPAFLGEPGSQTSPWPLQSYLAVGALPTAVPCARLHARQVVWEWGLDELSENIELVVTELVTNSVRASERLLGSRYHGRWAPGKPPVRLWLWSDGRTVLIEVWDGDNRMPVRKEVELNDESGRGLVLVEAVCAEWGVYEPMGGSGKVVWGMVVAGDG